MVIFYTFSLVTVWVDLLAPVPVHQENAAEEEDVTSGIQTFASATTSISTMIESADVDPLSNVAMCISGIDPRLCGPITMSTNQPFSYFQPANDSPRSDHSGDFWTAPTSRATDLAP